MKRSFQEKNWRTDPRFRRLCKALLSCRTEKEIADFLRDVATLSELLAWSERLEAAMLLADNVPYRDIAKSTGLSTATITRIATFLKNGDGYRGVMKRLKNAS